MCYCLSCSTLIQRANSWLEEHSGYNVVACETVTWTGRRFKDIYADSCASERSMHAAKSTKFLSGLRLWFHVEGIGCPSGQPTSAAPALVSRTFLPKPDERFDQFIHRVNKRLESDRLGGRIVSVEVVRLLCSNKKQYRPQLLNPNVSLWKEYPDCTKKFVHCVRVYALLTVHEEGYETIGYQDFVPEYNRRNKENKGYELFSDVMQRASRWIASQQSVRFTNVDTINVKAKRHTTFEERCIYSEHRCANHRLNYLTGPNRTTRYIRIVRAFFVVTKGVGVRMDYPSARLTFRTFTPLQLTRPTVSHPAEFEQTRQVVDRVNQWLQVTGANVFSVETLCIKMTRCPLQLLGSEATYSENSMTGAWAERWLYHIRLYLDGEYVEPPPAMELVQPNAQV
ncbi:hypothetical protein LSAT2_030924 [Lamellibrachia satsuma]|nr:hypothetical protein LSAT2_030924 [Lamellibrachia satsuma]